MSAENKQFQVRTILGSFFFVLVIILGIYKFDSVRNGLGLPVMSIVNITADLCSMALGYVLFLVSNIDASRNMKNLTAYLLLLIACFSSAFLDEICWLVDGDPSKAYLNAAANTLYYMGAPVMAFLFWRYVVSYLDLRKREVRIVNLFLAVGLAGAIIVRLVNLGFGYYFYVSADGQYHRGPLYLLSDLYA